jgi:hypothetical protein
MVYAITFSYQCDDPDGLILHSLARMQPPINFVYDIETNNGVRRRAQRIVITILHPNTACVCAGYADGRAREQRKRPGPAWSFRCRASQSESRTVAIIDTQFSVDATGSIVQTQR